MVSLLLGAEYYIYLVNNMIPKIVQNLDRGRTVWKTDKFEAILRAISDLFTDASIEEKKKEKKSIYYNRSKFDQKRPNEF